MAVNTDRLELYKKDPVKDAEDYFNISTMLNDNWDKIDKNVALLKDLDKHINDKGNPHNVTSDQVTTIKRMPSDARLNDYPDGVTVFYTNSIDDGYPHRYGNVLTVTGQSGTTGFQLFALNNFNVSRRKIYVRYYHGDADKGWSDWFKLADSLDLDEIKNSIDNLTKRDIGLGNVTNVKQATKSEFDDHTKTLGTYQSTGHVKLSNATNSQSSVSDGVAATPKAVKDAYDHAGDAHTKIEKHEDNKNNPHNVTKAQVGLGNVVNYKVATKAQAMAGTSNTAYMTPLRTSQYVKEISGESAAGVLAELNDHKGDNDNPHNVTKAQVGLGNVANYKVASKSQAEDATSNNTYMTPLRVLDFLKANGVQSVAGVKRDKDGNVPLTIADLTMDDYLPPTAPPRDYPVGITSFRTNATQAKEWGDLVGDSIVNTRFLVMTIKASSVWQSAQFIFSVDGYANTGNTIRHRNLYVRSTMASNQSTSNDWSTPIKIVDDRDLSDAIKKLTKSDVGLGNVTNVKQASKSEFDEHTNNKSNPHKVTKSQVGLGNVANYSTATQTEAEAGTATNKYMTPKTTADAIKKQAGDAVKGHTEDYNNPHKVTKAQVGLGNVTNVKQATKSEFDDHTKTLGTYQSTGHVKLSNATNSQSSVSDGVAATPLAVKTVNDRIEDLSSGDINITSPKDSDAPFTDYPLGVSVFYTNAGDSGYPNRIVTVMTVRDDDRSAFQFSARNGYNNDSKHMWYRIGHYQTGWSEWYKIADNRDVDEVKGLVEQAQKTADEAISKIPKLSSSVTSTSTSVGANSYAVKQAYDRASEALQAGVKQKQATADSLTSIGASLPDDPTWDELQNEIKKADYVREARVRLSIGQTKVPLDFYPSKASGNAYLYDEYSHLVVADENKILPDHVGTVYSAVPGSSTGATGIKAFVRAVGKSIEVVDKDLKPKPLPVNMELYIYGVAKK